eukprot:CAMPEP_0185845724 /NCGR_PEP_ID=MMETSP1354-20130828/1610_1 /TAXON_ID=708628 /ORGANISM="Erythrolobus madagascarensis, Strain CCMP3276" /LENGTH=290 /DNA_ID=CAMNT_0028545755 /DNA_START=73 /DNA_END=945 /DNA_ORIENTATION=-
MSSQGVAVSGGGLPVSSSSGGIGSTGQAAGANGETGFFGGRFANSGPGGGTAMLSRAPEYFRRLLNVPQMDLEYTFWQMVYLFVAPSRVYRTTKYHKQTKNQWARDDPAFVAVLTAFMAFAAFAYSIAFHARGFGGFVKSILYSVCIDFVMLGVLVASVNWWLANNYLRVDASGGGGMAAEQKVEWLYAFDIHCNAFFPLFIVLYVVQYFVLMFLLTDHAVATLLSNTLYGGALSYYCYITFLGFDILPFLQHTVVFLYPIALVGVGFVLLMLFRINITHVSVERYYYSW